jgi:hypothetical protein
MFSHTLLATVGVELFAVETCVLGRFACGTVGIIFRTAGESTTDAVESVSCQKIINE